MAAVATYVFLDLETSGLPREENNLTQITELCLVAVKRDHVLDTRPGASPRVQHKLTLCLNPGREIYPKYTEITGLSNKLLENEPTFNTQVFDLINNFLTILTKPVCLVAQNGLNFDFPILKYYLEKLKVTFPEDLLCADCLYAFFDILEEKKRIELCKDQETTLDGGSNDKETNKTTETIQNTEASTSKVDSDKVRQFLNATGTHLVESLLTNEDSNAPNSLPMHLLNESSQKLKPNSADVPQKCKEIKKNENRISKVRKRVFWGSGSKPKDSNQLKDIYKRLLNRPAIGAYRAEKDCILVLESSMAVAIEFVKWIDKNHIPFSEVNTINVEDYGIKLGVDHIFKYDSY